MSAASVRQSSAANSSVRSRISMNRSAGMCPPEIGTGEAEPTRDANVLCRQFDEELPTLVGRCSLPFDELEQIVRHDHSGNRSAMKRACRTAREEIDARQHRERKLFTPDPAQKLIVLAHVPADLIDDESSARHRFLSKLQILRHDFSLVALVIRHDTSEEEVGRVEVSTRPRVGQSVVHVGEQCEQADRVEIKNRFRYAAVTLDGIITRQREYIVEILRMPASRLDSRAHSDSNPWSQGG